MNGTMNTEAILYLNMPIKIATTSMPEFWSEYDGQFALQLPAHKITLQIIHKIIDKKLNQQFHSC